VAIQYVHIHFVYCMEISLQFGSFSCLLNAHKWNIQRSISERSIFEAAESYDSTQLHLMQNINSSVKYFPRALVFDLR